MSLANNTRVGHLPMGSQRRRISTTSRATPAPVPPAIEEHTTTSGFRRLRSQCGVHTQESAHFIEFVIAGFGPSESLGEARFQSAFKRTQTDCSADGPVLAGTVP